MKAELKQARLSLGADNKLLLVVPDGLAYDYFKKEGKKEEVERLISDFIQKEVEITIQNMSEDRNFEDQYIDLSKIVMTDIEIEE